MFVELLQFLYSRKLWNSYFIFFLLKKNYGSECVRKACTLDRFFKKVINSQLFIIYYKFIYSYIHYFKKLSLYKNKKS